MRPVWKGHISFGLVNVPVTLYPAEQRTDLQLHLIDAKDKSRVRYERVNAETGEEVPWDRIVKGFEYDDGSYVVIDKDELKRVAPEATQAVEIERFVDLAEVDLMYFDRPYFLEPGKKGEKGYALLREALRETGRAGIAKVVIRTREYVAAVVPRGDALVLNLLRFRQELRDAGDLDLPSSADKAGVKENELKMARDLIGMMTREWEPEVYHDEYRERLQQYIDERIERGETEAAPDTAAEPEEPRGPFNMMEALKRSLGEGDGSKRTKKDRSKSSGKPSGSRGTSSKSSGSSKKASKKSGSKRKAG